MDFEVGMAQAALKELEYSKSSLNVDRFCNFKQNDIK